MCTVVFVPVRGGGFILGHNRDERRSRARGAPPERFSDHGVAYLAPGDPEGGGSWIGVNEAGVAACLLNAADPEGRDLPPRPPSRGLLVRDAMACRSVEEVARELASGRRELETMRSFRLVVVQSATQIGESAGVSLAWDGRDLVREAVAGPSLFVSSTRDPQGAEAARRSSWARILAADTYPGLAEIGGFLASHEPERGARSVCMHRDDARTVSRTLVTAGSRLELAYLDGPPCAPEAPEIRVAL